MDKQQTASWLALAGGILMVLGAVDPLEGSLLILLGSGLMAVGAFGKHRDQREVRYRLGVFIAVALGVGAMFGLTAVGGFGGSSGLSMWWGLLVLPYLIGWSLGIWAPSSPKWMLWGGIVVSMWYFAILAKILEGITTHPDPFFKALPGAILAAFGVLTLIGCIYRLRSQRHTGGAAPG